MITLFRDGILVLVLLLVLVYVIMTSPAFSHSWYDEDCCSGKDCDVATQVEYVPGGRLITSRHGTAFVPYGFSKTRPSQDNDIHICMVLGPVVYKSEVAPGRPLLIPRCVYEPAGV